MDFWPISTWNKLKQLNKSTYSIFVGTFGGLAPQYQKAGYASGLEPNTDMQICLKPKGKVKSCCIQEEIFKSFLK